MHKPKPMCSQQHLSKSKLDFSKESYGADEECGVSTSSTGRQWSRAHRSTLKGELIACFMLTPVQETSKPEPAGILKALDGRASR